MKSNWLKHSIGRCDPVYCDYCKKGWDGKCHGCQKRINQEYVAQVGPYWICDPCVKAHFTDSEYSVNQAAEILLKIRNQA